MPLNRDEAQVGVRELHDRLSEYLEKVEQGTEVVVTRRGKPIARLSQIDEKGSELALELWERSTHAVSSLLAYPEGRAALAAASRGGRLNERLYREAQAGFDQTYEELIAVGIDQRLIRTAGALASELSLRGYDAVHLATALDLAGQDVALITWDRDLSRAALAAGLAVLGDRDG